MLNGLSQLKRIPGRRAHGVYLAVIGVLLTCLLFVMGLNRQMQIRDAAMRAALAQNISALAQQQEYIAVVEAGRAEAQKRAVEAQPGVAVIWVAGNASTGVTTTLLPADHRDTMKASE